LTDLKKINTNVVVTAKPKHEHLHEVEGANLVFSYLIRIENQSNDTIKLLRRHWFICDGNYDEREVEGQGVVGEQPILEPGDTFEYQSWCPIISEFGYMGGYYTFNSVEKHENFIVEIPTFLLLPNYVLN